MTEPVNFCRLDFDLLKNNIWIILENILNPKNVLNFVWIKVYILFTQARWFCLQPEIFIRSPSEHAIVDEVGVTGHVQNYEVFANLSQHYKILYGQNMVWW